MLEKQSNTKPWNSKPRPFCQSKKPQTKHSAACILFWDVPALTSQENREDRAAIPRMGWIWLYKFYRLFIYIFFSLMEHVVVLAARQKCLVCLQGCCTTEGAQQELPAGHCVPRQWGRVFFTVIPISTHISRQWWAGTSCLCRFSHIKWGCSLSEAIRVSNIAKTTHSSC